ncbi:MULTISPECIES: TIR domain-containing protein [Aerococcus]|uniref:Molecular chaperone Tir n=2 Tax=Aerococcus TaxID=1375 RepID=A0A178HDP4_9LACT|nr:MULTISPECIES: TIR domain-containing protein [Aerococcus]KAA9218308.1 molecular chaperone Tir [Aerococcus loyolae]KAA9264245.1 molecular chaperone Tir [Aerococcus loyolae]MCY3026381.1 TIR domain-containing protein [Aerococcus loyolae]MCY3027891.1 TIR domain-containing protein [Aerococcus loyolae]MCY3029853.1 TIR domain-containing protein [Aerococcus loyolae]
MRHKCFISFKYKDLEYKERLQNDDTIKIDMIDKSLDEPINSDDPDYVMRIIRRDYLKDSTVTLHLIGKYSAENSIFENQYYIKKELQASLSDTDLSSKNGILGIVLPEMYDDIYIRERTCSECGKKISMLNLNDDTTITEFSYNYFIPNNKCHWSFDDRYCVLVKWDNFIEKPNFYIDLAFDKRDEPIAKKTKVRPKKK